jgi:hypothetical protein
MAVKGSDWKVVQDKAVLEDARAANSTFCRRTRNREDEWKERERDTQPLDIFFSQSFELNST